MDVKANVFLLRCVVVVVAVTLHASSVSPMMTSSTTATTTSTSSTTSTTAFIPCDFVGEEFLCEHDDQCIPFSKKCDGTKDCTKGEDETGCEPFSCSEKHLFACASGEECISAHWKCDGNYDCADKSDEVGCTITPTYCAPTEFKCHSTGVCLMKDWQCDGDIDCTDGSDESEAVCRPEISAPKNPCVGTVCKANGKCISHNWVCDKQDDCPDGEDEGEQCEHMHPVETCGDTAGLFLCKDKSRCLSASIVCDGVKDCADGSDEEGKCAEACKQANNVNGSVLVNTVCSENAKCLPTPAGGACYCDPGFKMNPTGGFCADVNECREFGTCSQDCRNTKGGFKCSCRPGYKKELSSRSCKAFNSGALLLFSTKSQLRVIELSPHKRTYSAISENSSSLNEAIGIAFDGVDSRVYWTAVKEKKQGISSSRLDGGDVRYEVSDGLVSPQDLAIDYLARNVYFTDSHTQIIGVFNMVSKMWTTIISETVDKPRGIDVFPERGILFYSDWGVQPGIMKAGMDGKNVERIVKLPKAHWPNGVAVDGVLERIFWSEAKQNILESAKFDGSDRRILSMGVAKHPFSVAVFEDTLYWSDWQTREIRSVNKFTGKNDTVLIKEAKMAPMGIAIHHPVLEKLSLANPCAFSFCTHLCLLSGDGGYTCECPHDMVKLGNNVCKSQEAAAVSPRTVIEGVENWDENKDKDLVKVGSRIYVIPKEQEELEVKKIELEQERQREKVAIEKIRKKIEEEKTFSSEPESPPSSSSGVVKEAVAAVGSQLDSKNRVVVGIVLPLIALILVGLGIYVCIRRRRSKHEAGAIRFRNPSFSFGPEEELKNVEVIGGRVGNAKHNDFNNPQFMGSSASAVDMSHRQTTAFDESAALRRSLTNPSLFEEGATSTPALVPRSNTMDSSKSGPSSVDEEDGSAWREMVVGEGEKASRIFYDNCDDKERLLE